MQTILAIDTCTEVLSVCLSHSGQTYHRLVQGVAKSSGLVLNLCDEIFTEAGIKPSEIELICYTKGPGAFTGVRMCVGVAQGLSYAHKIPTLGLSTLEVLGYGAAKQLGAERIAVALDARMSEVYWGVYEAGQLGPELLKKPEDVPQLDDDFVGAGSGWGAYTKALSTASGVTQHHSALYPRAEDMIEMALTQQRTTDSTLPLPTYLRNNVAQKSLK